MTLPTSGPLSLSDIQTEFGGTAPTSLSEYYAGGAYVPSGTSGTNGPVPSSGAIGIANFYGTSSLVINFGDAYPYALSYFSAKAGYVIAGVNATGVTAGNVYEDVNNTLSQLEQWITPKSQATNYEVYATYAGVAPSGSSLNSWVSCSSNPYWYIQATGNQTYTSTVSLQVRKIGTTTVLDTWNVYLTAESYL